MPKGYGCRVHEIYLALDSKEQAAMVKLIHAPISSERIAIMLTEFGHRVSYQTVRRHVLGICSCGGRFEV